MASQRANCCMSFKSFCLNSLAPFLSFWVLPLFFPFELLLAPLTCWWRTETKGAIGFSRRGNRHDDNIPLAAEGRKVLKEDMMSKPEMQLTLSSSLDLWGCFLPESSLGIR